VRVCACVCGRLLVTSPPMVPSPGAWCVVVLVRGCVDVCVADC